MNELPKDNENNNIKSSFSLTPVLSVFSIIVSLAALYVKSKDLMYFFQPTKQKIEVESTILEDQGKSKPKIETNN